MNTFTKEQALDAIERLNCIIDNLVLAGAILDDEEMENFDDQIYVLYNYVRNQEESI